MKGINVIITGATGMVGKGVLFECLDSREVQKVLVVNRHPLKIEHPKLQQLLLEDFFDLSAVAPQFTGYDTCFFCLGVSAVGMSEKDYTKVTYELTLLFARILLAQNTGMTFCYVSGTGTDSSEKGGMMWARIKGRTENELRKLPFKKTYFFRPGVIQPKRGIRSKTAWYNAAYIILGPVLGLMKWISPSLVTTTTCVGQAMISVATGGSEKIYLENKDINRLAASNS